jgi:hypothetical protein
MRSWVALMVLAAGCWGQRAATESGAVSHSVVEERPAQRWPASGRAHAQRRELDRCAQAINHFFEVVAQDVQSQGFSNAMAEEIQGTMIESCRDTAWSVESLACYEEASSVSQAGNCFQAMTPEQREDFDKRFTEIRQRQRSMSPSASPP